MGKLTHTAGDKVRIKKGPFKAIAGRIVEVLKDQLLVEIPTVGKSIFFTTNELVNYSLSARKAWRTEPNRGAGRKKRPTNTAPEKVSVTLRFNRVLWAKFLELEQAGIVANRTEEVNKWLVLALNLAYQRVGSSFYVSDDESKVAY